jgi:hypothetical protein
MGWWVGSGGVTTERGFLINIFFKDKKHIICGNMWTYRYIYKMIAYRCEGEFDGGEEVVAVHAHQVGPFLESTRPFLLQGVE